MSDESVAARIERLVAEEHDLRTREQAERDDDGALGADRARLSEVGIELDCCWDLRAAGLAPLRLRRPPRDARPVRAPQRVGHA